MEELRLIKLIQKNGDRSAADQLIRSYYDNIYRFVKKQINNSEDALDLTQEIFISMLRTIARFDPKKDAGFKTWLYKIASNKIIDLYRSKKFKENSITLPLDEIEPVEADGFAKNLENKFEDKNFSEKVQAFVGELNPETQKIFRLHIFGDYTFSEIAKFLNLPESSVKSKYYRLLNLLRKEFADYDRT